MTPNALPSHWHIKKLGEVCEIKNGKNQKNVENPNGKFPIYGSAGIMGYADNYICDENTIIVGRKGNINKPIYVSTKFWNVDTAFGLCANQDALNTRFLFNFCNSFNFSTLDKSTTIPSLAKTDLLKIELPLPPLPEQEAIVAKIESLFAELEAGKSALLSAREQIKLYRQSLLKAAFEGKLTEMGKKPVETGQLPEGWKWVKLGEVCEITSSRRIFQDEYVSSGIPFYRTKEIKELSEGKEITIDLYISNEKYDDIRKNNRIPIIGDILMSAVGTIGVSYIIKDDSPFYFKDGNLVWLREFKNINSKYLNYILLFFIRMSKEINLSGSAYNALTIVKLKEFELPLPPLSTQEKIVTILEEKLGECDALDATIEKSLTDAELLRQSILKEAFEGRLVKVDV